MRKLNTFGFTTHEQVSNWYDNKFTEMGGSWHVPPEELDDFLDRLGVWHVNDEKSWVLLELGCGDGKLLERAMLRGGEVIGIDISHVACAMAESRLKQKFPPTTFSATSWWDIFDDSMESLQFDDNLFDFVICYGSLEHSLDIPKAVGEMARVLKSGGKFLNYAPNEAWVHEDQPLETTMTADEWLALYDTAGLQISSVTRVGDNNIYVGYKP